MKSERAMTTNWNRALRMLVPMACLSIVATLARAQTPCQGTSGPDVIVGDISGPWNYVANGTLEAVSLGTTSCNQGTVGVGWHSNTNQHPVIGGELYRFKLVNGAGRFEQIGLSWLKHGFFAESQKLCCSNCQSTNGTTLGVGCSDPYTADRNGTQSLMGPRYQVNAFKGTFIYPPPTPTGVNTGRLEVDISDLDNSSPGGTRYFGNCQYIAPDDAATGHGNNNCSHREMSCSGSGSTWTFGFVVGQTVREIPAIRAWADCESGVTVQDVQVPNEGLLMLGFKTTSLGGGQYHYEYALYNMNSDVSVGSFSLPVANNIAITNVGFHDVTYRGGDGLGGVNFDGTDWPSTQASGNLSWATSTFGANPNANAIRWGTTYNFRFDANSPPMTGTITIGTFKDGGLVLTSADVPGGELPPGVAFCFGDGSGGTCPCANLGDQNSGCPNSQNPSGAVLNASGTTSPDTIVLTSSGEIASALSVVFQSSSFNVNGVAYGDGLRCISGPLKRLYIKNAVAGVVTAPTGGDPSITVQSAAKGDTILPGSTRYYQIVYRDPSATFCPSPSGNTFNITSGQSIAW